MTVLLTVLLAVSASACAPRTEPDGDFRAYTRPARVCRGLISGIGLHFPHVVRLDEFTRNESGAPERRVILQFPGRAGTVESELLAELESKGFRRVAAPRVSAGTASTWFRKRGYGTVGVAVRPIPDTSAATPVRGYVDFRLPVESFTRKAQKRCQAPVHDDGQRTGQDPWRAL